MYQTVSGLLIPLSALLSRVVLKRAFTRAQMGAIAVVICGLAVKARDVADEAARRGTAIDARGISIACAATVSYGFRGLVMEHLSASKSSLSGNAQTMLMGTCGLAAFAIYTLARTSRDMDGMVWAYYDASPRDVRAILKVHLGNMLSRAFMVKMMMARRRQSGRHAVGALERDSQRRRHRVFARLILLGRRETVFELQRRHQRRHGCHRRSRVRDEWAAENRRRRRAQNGSREENHSRRRARRRKTDSVALFERPSPLRASRIVKSRSKHSMPLIAHIS